MKIQNTLAQNCLCYYKGFDCTERGNAQSQALSRGIFDLVKLAKLALKRTCSNFNSSRLPTSLAYPSSNR
jgi:hypothetical protein